jgi:hypothetical protein
METPPIPAGLHEARDQALRAELAQCDARHAELAVVSPRPTRDLAPVADAGLARVAGQLGQLEARLEALLHGIRLVVGDGEQTLAPTREFLHELATVLVLFDCAFLSHRLFSGVRV